MTPTGGTDAARRLSKVLHPWIEAACSLAWQPNDGFGLIIIRAALRRQLAACDYLIRMVERNEGFLGVALLRPACEELIWLRYLCSLEDQPITRLSEALIRRGIRADLEAQAGEIGSAGMRNLGLLRHLDGFKRRKDQDVSALQEIGEELRWPRRTIKRGDVPSTWFIAKSTGSEDLYRFLYHATSRYAHFRPVELARQGWSRGDNFSIDPSQYSGQWSDFVACWAPRILAWSAIAAADHILETQGLEFDQSEFDKAIQAIAAEPLVPIITADELAWD